MKPIWICGHRKCGTTLLTNLLDGHSRLINYGSDVRLLYALYNSFDTYGDEVEIKERFWTIFNDDRTMDDAINKETVKSIIEKLDFSSREVVWRYLEDIVSVFGTEKRLVFKETSSELYRGSLSKNLDPYFIQLVRDPRDNWAAISAGMDNYYSKLGEVRLDALSSLINRIHFGFIALKRNLKLSAGSYSVIKFESLVANTQETVRDLCSKVDIQFEPMITSPSRAGEPYSGNSHDGYQFDGVSSLNLGRYKERITTFEACVIEALLQDMMEYFGYEISSSALEREEALQEFYCYYNSRYFYYDKYAER